MTSWPICRNSPRSMSPGLTSCSCETIKNSFLLSPMMGLLALAGYGSFVPVLLYCETYLWDIRPARARKVTFDDEEGHPANPVCAHRGWSPTGLGRSGYRARNDQGRELADPPPVRMGEPCMAALDPLLHRQLPLHSLRR